MLAGVNVEFGESVIRQEDPARIDQDVATSGPRGKLNIELVGHIGSRGRVPMRSASARSRKAPKPTA